MHIKKFEGRDLQEALGRIRNELGPEAVILETSRSSGAGVAVLAALPRESGEDLPARAAGPERPRFAIGAGPGASRVEQPARFAASPPRVAAGSSEQLESRLSHLSRLVRSDHFSAVPLPLRQLYFDLSDAEVDADLVFRILQRMGSAPLPGQFTPAPSREVLALLREMVTAGGAVRRGGARRVLALIGPTGVGKTTTAAKIAGQAAFALGMRVALISSDAYRVFGAQHLGTYAALMGLPFETVSTGTQLRALLEGACAASDLVLIDTSGRSPRDPRGISEIRGLLAACPGLETHLVLAANCRARDLVLALTAFSGIPVDHLIFTKCDEATSTGGAFSAALKARRPVSYLGTGQEVPDDLEAATSEALTTGLLREGN
jgi:flagellar biosynthesis protein FlhF